jgi:phage terminase large subunit-like protein
MHATAQRLAREGIEIEEFPQTVGNLTDASQNLYEIIRGRNFVAYPAADIRLAISRAIAIETARGWRIAKDKQSHKIDVVVALAMAALGAVRANTQDVYDVSAKWMATLSTDPVDTEAERLANEQWVFERQMMAAMGASNFIHSRR